MSKRRSRTGPHRRQRGGDFEPTEELDFEPVMHADLDDEALEHLADYDDFDEAESFRMPQARPRKPPSSWRDYDYEDDWN